MADVEVVIKIDELKYNTIMNYPKKWDEWGLNAIKQGKLLPKGHGDLIDASKLNVALLMGELYGNKTAIQVIDEAKPIIEADKGD